MCDEAQNHANRGDKADDVRCQHDKASLLDFQTVGNAGEYDDQTNGEGCETGNRLQPTWAYWFAQSDDGFKSRSLASCRSRTCSSSAPQVLLTRRPRCTAGRDRIAFAQRNTLVYDGASRNSADS